MRKKGFQLSVLLMVMIIVLALAGFVLAGSVYDRAVVTLTAGDGTWTNDVPYAALALKRIWIEEATKAANTCAVTRITAGSTIVTQTVGSVAYTTGGAGSTASFTAGYCKFGDKLVFNHTVNSNATAIIEYEVQKH